MEVIEQQYSTASIDDTTGFLVLHFYEENMSQTLFIDPSEIIGVSSYARWNHHNATIYTKTNGSFSISEKPSDVIKLLGEVKIKDKKKKVLNEVNYGRE